jgi:hypothetical protein
MPTSFSRRRRSLHTGLLIFCAVLCLIVLGLMNSPVLAQTPTPEPDVETTQEAETTPAPFALTATEMILEATSTQAAIDTAATNTAGTQAVIDATESSRFATQSVIDATATGAFFATQTATVRPRPTDTFQPFITVLSVEPRNTTGTYSPENEIRFIVRLWNSGQQPEARPVRVQLIFDTETFTNATEENITEGGQIDEGTVTWRTTDVFLPGEESAREFILSTTVRADITENREGTVQVIVTNSSGVRLAGTEVMQIPIVVQQQDAAVETRDVSNTVPQGEGLFQNEGTFALLIGLFFGLGGLAIFGLGALIIYRIDDDDAKEHTFKGTTEILLLLIVLFSVIVMGVQNAIDRESINAIIGGIVGYVAGRVTNRITIPRRAEIPPPSPPGMVSATPPPIIPPEGSFSEPSPAGETRQPAQPTGTVDTTDKEKTEDDNNTDNKPLIP